MRTPFPEQYRTAEELERHLGDPCDPESGFSFDAAVESDERDEYPEAACALLDRWRFFDYYVPAPFGGRLTSFEEFAALLRVVARRDLTVAIGHGKTFLGAVSTWVAGSDEQKRLLAGIVKSGRQAALALTEREHGSDLLATEMKADKVPGGYLLSGEKWLVNNATRGTALTVLARTKMEGGPRGFSLLLVEKNGGHDRAYTHLPKVKTHGIRGADISGIRFDSLPVDERALIGGPGDGFEILLKAFQLTRTVIPALSLGAADTALRTTLDFALARRLYGNNLLAIPHARKLLVDAFVDLLICDCLTTVTARAVHAATEQMSLLSAIAKFYVPETVEGLINSASIVLGARHYLREGHRHGIFQKVVRDNAILGLFDGSAAVNLNSIALQLGQLANNQGRSGGGGTSSTERLKTVCSLSEPLPDFDPANLTLHSRGHNLILQGLGDCLARVSALTPAQGVSAEVLRDIETLTLALINETDRLAEEVRHLIKTDGHVNGRSPEMFEAAERYSALHAAASAAQVWVHNRNWMSEGLAGGEWLVLGLMRVLRRLGAGEGLVAEVEYEARVGELMRRWHEEGRMFSVVPLRLADSLAHAASV